MQMKWVNCYRCSGRGYKRNEIEGSYQCVQCEGVGKVEVPDLDDLPPTLVRTESGYVLPARYFTRNRNS